MMESINKLFEAKDEYVIFRYMDFSKFMDLLINKKLFFCNTKYFEDKYEGCIPEDAYPKASERNIERSKYYANKSLEWCPAYVNSWNGKKNEDYSLWKIYTNPKTGIAIKTTVGRLKKALNNNDIKIYMVKYIKSFDKSGENLNNPFYLREDKDRNINIYRNVPEIHKLSFYEYEKEIRAVYLDYKKVNGISFDVNIDILIDEIYISPFASNWFVQLVKNIIKDNKEISNRNVCKSEIILRQNYY